MKGIAKAMRDLVAAASAVPIVRRGNEPPFSTCLGCGATDSQPCLKACWVHRLEVAIENAKPYADGAR